MSLACSLLVEHGRPDKEEEIEHLRTMLAASTGSADEEVRRGALEIGKGFCRGELGG
jgi:hypothetical protein